MVVGGVRVAVHGLPRVQGGRLEEVAGGREGAGAAGRVASQPSASGARQRNGVLRDIH